LADRLGAIQIIKAARKAADATPALSIACTDPSSDSINRQSADIFPGFVHFDAGGTRSSPLY
jgi:hypothetical protein